MTWINFPRKLINHRLLFIFDRNHLGKLFGTPSGLVSLESLKNLPATGNFKLKNNYIPISRRTLLREILQDSSVIHPSDRVKFEQLALFLSKRFNKEFRLLENEFSVLFSPTISTVRPLQPNSTHATSFANNNDEVSQLKLLSKTELLDREFWLIRRLTELLTSGGFVEVTRDQLEHACQPKRLNRKQAISFVDPHDYEVIRFWIRGVHPSDLRTVSANDQSNSVDKTTVSFLKRVSLTLSRTVQSLSGLRQKEKSRLWSLLRSVSNRVKRSRRPSGISFTNVLMVVRGAQEDWLEVKLFGHVPSSRASASSNYTDSLTDLLPKLRFRSLTTTNRLLLAASGFTALGCFGIVIPTAWLFITSPDLVIAWSVAATAGAVATAGLVWAQHWRSLANSTDHLKWLHYNCSRGSGFQAIRTLLQMIVEEKFKSTLLTYALLLQATNSGSSVSPVQLGVRAESWIAKRLTPNQHTPVIPSVVLNEFDFPESAFLGGSGPLFDLVFEVEQPLNLLRKLDLVRGSDSNPQPLPLSSAVTAHQCEHDSTGGLDSLWILDPLTGNTVDRYT